MDPPLDIIILLLIYDCVMIAVCICNNNYSSWDLFISSTKVSSMESFGPFS